jgi:hypothetical protein
VSWLERDLLGRDLHATSPRAQHSRLPTHERVCPLWAAKQRHVCCRTCKYFDTEDGAPAFFFGCLLTSAHWQSCVVRYRGFRAWGARRGLRAWRALHVAVRSSPSSAGSIRPSARGNDRGEQLTGSPVGAIKYHNTTPNHQAILHTLGGCSKERSWLPCAITV